MRTPQNIMLLMLIGIAGLGPAQAQHWVEVSAGTSMAEEVVTKASVGMPLNDRWQVLGNYRYAQNRYTFIDARPVTDGDAMQVSLGANMRLVETGPIRLDAFLLGGYRRVEDDGEPVEQTAHFITVEPGLVASLQLSDALTLQTGVNLWLVQQRSPSVLGEQVQNAVLQLGGTYAITDHLLATFYVPVGPSYGGGGDTHKFYWEARAGLRYAFGNPLRHATILFP